MKGKGSSALAAAVALFLFGSGSILIGGLPLSGPAYSPDELVWITSGQFAFRKFFVERDWSTETWRENRFGSFGKENPTIGRFVVGASVYIHGFRSAVPVLDGFESPSGFNWNRLKRSRPPAELLAAGRRPVHWMGVLSAVLLFLLVRELTGSWRIGAVAGVLWCLDPLVIRDSRRATMDVPALAFSLLALVAATQVWRRPTGSLMGRVLGFAIVGVACGLALGTKLNALLAVGVCLSWGASRAMGWGAGSTAVLEESRFSEGGDSDDALRHADRGERFERRVAVAGAAMVVGVAAAVFIASNPFLYEETREGLVTIWEHGRMVSQLDAPSAQRLESWPARLGHLWHVGTETSGVLHRWLGLPFADGLLALLGVGLCVRRAIAPRHSPEGGGHAWLLWWLAVTAVGIVVWTPFKWARFYLPLEPGWCALEAVALVAVGTWLARKLPLWSRRFNAG